MSSLLPNNPKPVTAAAAAASKHGDVLSVNIQAASPLPVDTDKYGSAARFTHLTINVDDYRPEFAHSASSTTINKAKLYRAFADFRLLPIKSFRDSEGGDNIVPEPYFAENHKLIPHQTFRCSIDEVEWSNDGIRVASAIVPDPQLNQLLRVSAYSPWYSMPIPTDGQLQQFLMSKLIPRLIEDTFWNKYYDAPRHEMAQMVMGELGIGSILIGLPKIEGESLSRVFRIDIESWIKKDRFTPRLKKKTAAAAAATAASAAAAELSRKADFAAAVAAVAPKPKKRKAPAPPPIKTKYNQSPVSIDATATGSPDTAVAASAAAAATPAKAAKADALPIQNDPPTKKAKTGKAPVRPFGEYLKELEQKEADTAKLYNATPETENDDDDGEDDGDYKPPPEKNADDDTDSAHDPEEGDGDDKKPKALHDRDDSDSDPSESGHPTENDDPEESVTSKRRLCSVCKKGRLEANSTSCLFCQSKCFLCKKAVENLETGSANWEKIKSGKACGIVCKPCARAVEFD
jgi:hypothetical protein